MTPNDETLLGHGIGMTPIDDNLESKSAAGATKKLQPGLLKPSDEAPLGTYSPKSRDIGVSEIDFSDISQATYAYRTNQVDDRLLRID